MQGEVLARHSSAQAQLVCPGVPKSLSLLTSLGDSPLQPWPGGSLGGQDTPTLQCPSSSFLSLHHTAKHPSKPVPLGSAQEHPGLQKLLGLDASNIANAIPKPPLHRAPACTAAWHTTPAPVRTSPTWGSHEWHHGCTSPQRPRAPDRLGTDYVTFALPRLCTALQCLAGTSGAEEAAELGAQPPPHRDACLCHPAWVLSL